MVGERMHYKSMHRHQTSGFTIIELMVAIGIIAILASVSLPIFGKHQQRAAVERARGEVVSVLRDAQSRSIAGEGGELWSVVFETTAYSLLRGTTVYQRYDLDGVEFAATNVFDDGAGGTTNRVVFAALDGTTVNAGSIAIRHSRDTSDLLTITINSLGRVNAQ
jgi:prepilin-type N-terminal cleavage/methylation domain-containing protein